MSPEAQLALFEERPKQRKVRSAPAGDKALNGAIEARPGLERQLRVIRALCDAECTVFSVDRVVEHAGGERTHAREACLYASDLGWVYPYDNTQQQYIPSRKRGKKR